jgi:hypothetical protein
MKYVIPTAVFVAGFSIAWIIAPLSQQPVTPSDGTHAGTRSVTKVSVRPDDGRATPATRKLLNKLLADAAANDTPEWELEKIPEADYPALLAELIKRVGDSKMTSDNRIMMNSLIWDWHDANPDAALKWVLELENPKVANRLLSTLIGKVAEKDLHEAIALAERHGAAQGRHLEMPNSLRKGLGTVDAVTFARAFACFTNPSSPSWFTRMDYAEGFDFRNTLDKLTEIQASLEKGTYLSVMPSDLLSEWAKRDWNAAWEWAASGEKSDMKDLADLVTRAAGTATTEQLAGYAVQAATLPNQTAEKNFSQAHEILAARPSPELITAFLSRMPGDRQQNLEGILAQSFGGSDTLRDMMLIQMTPAERIASFQSEAVRKSLNWINKDESVAKRLRQLGHNDAEIARMLPPAPTK